MARLPVPGSDDGTWGEVLNGFLSVSHTSSGSLKDSAIPDGSITNTKLANSAISGAKLQDGAITNAKVAAGAEIAQSKVANLTADLANKTDVGHTHAIAEVDNLQTELDGKAATAHAHSIESLTDTDTTTTPPADGQPLTWSATSSQWEPKTITGPGGDTYIEGAGVAKVTVDSAAPSGPAIGDVWIQTP